MSSSVNYYNQNSDAFFHHAMKADVSSIYRKFLHYISKPSRILDAGCGVGRDAKYFYNLGYDVVALDASIKMVKLSTELLGKEVLHMPFKDIEFSEEFDAIWACATLLHIPYAELRGTLKRLHRALKPGGIFYASFKNGKSVRAVETRTFYDMDEETIQPYINGIFDILEMWQTDDLGKSANPSKSWLNVICKKRTEEDSNL